ncbi:V-type proton ATPase subunit H [Cocos nucifera]|nr:V-type proton ATPase subunit H [Cocos nucifera]
MDPVGPDLGQAGPDRLLAVAGPPAVAYSHLQRTIAVPVSFQFPNPSVALLNIHGLDGIWEPPSDISFFPSFLLYADRFWREEFSGGVSSLPEAFRMDRAELTTEQVLKRDIPWETYMSTKLITGTCLQLLRRYDNRSESQRAALLDDVLKRDIPWETYMSTKLITGTCLQLLRRYDNRSESQRAALLDDDGPAYVRVFVNILRDIVKEETVEYVLALIDEMLTDCYGEATGSYKKRAVKYCLSYVRPKIQDGIVSNGNASHSKSTCTGIDDVLKGLVEWLCSQLLYEACLCIWLLSYYDAAVDYMATTRIMPRLVEVVKSSTKEKVVRVIVLTFRNLLAKGAFGAQMVDLGLPQIVQSLKAQAWSDEDLLDALNQLEDGLKDNIKRLSSFDKYKQEVLLGHLDWSPMHKDPNFWRENITNFEENDFQILHVLVTILDTSNDPTALAVACYDLSQFIQYHPGGRIVVSDLKAKERAMKLMNHENAEVTKNALLCVQRLFLGAKYASFLQS